MLPFYLELTKRTRLFRPGEQESILSSSWIVKVDPFHILIITMLPFAEGRVREIPEVLEAYRKLGTNAVKAIRQQRG